MKPGLYAFDRGLSTTRIGYAFVIEVSRSPGKVRARIWNNRRKSWFRPQALPAVSFRPATPDTTAARAALASIARGEHRS